MSTLGSRCGPDAGKREWFPMFLFCEGYFETTVDFASNEFDSFVFFVLEIVILYSKINNHHY